YHRRLLNLLAVRRRTCIDAVVVHRHIHESESEWNRDSTSSLKNLSCFAYSATTRSIQTHSALLTIVNITGWTITIRAFFIDSRLGIGECVFTRRANIVDTLQRKFFFGIVERT